MQAQRIAQAVKEGMDAVLLSCSDARAVTPAIDDAVAHGVPVMTFDSDAPDSRRFAYCGVDDVKAGEMIMAELARLVPRGAHVAVLAGNRAAPNLSRRVEGVLREAARHPDMKVVGTFYTVETPEEASATVIQIDAAHPDIDGLGDGRRLGALHEDVAARAQQDEPAPAPARENRFHQRAAAAARVRRGGLGAGAARAADVPVGRDRRRRDRRQGHGRKSSSRRTSRPSWCASRPTTSASGRVSCAPGASPTCRKSCSAAK